MIQIWIVFWQTLSMIIYFRWKQQLSMFTSAWDSWSKFCYKAELSSFSANDACLLVNLNSSNWKRFNVIFALIGCFHIISRSSRNEWSCFSPVFNNCAKLQYVLGSNAISVLLTAVWLLSSKGLFGKLLSNVMVSLMNSFINIGLSSWCFCFFSLVVEDSTFWNYSIIWQSSGPHNSHPTNADSSCRSMREVTLLTLFMYLLFCSCSWSSAMRENCLLVFKNEKFRAANYLYSLGQRCFNYSISNQ